MKKADILRMRAERERVAEEIRQISVAIIRQKTIPESVLNGALNIAAEWKIARTEAIGKAPFLSRFDPRHYSLKSVVERRDMIKSLAVKCGAL